MDGLSVAANVIAVVELTAKVASLCVQYSTAVKNARSDIERLQRELNSLEAVLFRARSLAEGPHGAKLQAIQRLQGVLDDASSQLLHLSARMEEKLANSKTRKAMSRFGIRALKWPFESSEIETIIRNLDRNRDALSTALIIDNTALQIDTNSKIEHIGQTLDISRLPLAKDAAFDSHMDEHDARCLPNTRVELRQEITTWAISPDSDTVFWLNGMAGTGKSTISRTIAQTFADKGCLGASFFFKRGERDRGNASRLFTTIAAQLIAQLPDIGASVMEAIDEDPSLPNRTIREQFNKLILNPLRALDDETTQTKTFVLVLDALDECDRVDDVRLIINLLTLPKSLSSIKLRAFVTSRPELPILLGFSSIKGKYRDLVLHEIPKPVIEHDISEFLHHRLEEIRKEYNSLSDPNFQLDASWPGGEATDALLQMAIPLFIFAATICRFIQDPLFDPPNQLTKVLKYQTTKYDSEIEKLDTTYRPTLDQMLVGRTGRAKDRVLSNFRAIVGTIVLLAEPLSVLTLSILLDIPESAITSILRSLHSVLHVPNSVSTPIRILHLSFRDFLVDPELRDTNPFWVDEKATHERIATNCLRLLTTGNHLQQDICGLIWPGISRYEVDEQLIDSKLPDEIGYACLYWPHHLEQGGVDITDNHEAHVFLRDHFLFWLEALSLLGRFNQSSSMINTLQSITSSSNGEDVSRFLHDAAKFQSTYKAIIDEYPLQLYASGITFAPQNSVVKAACAKYRPEWILQPPQANEDWDTCLRVIDTSLSLLNTALFLPDNRGLMIASRNGPIQIWDPVAGEEKDSLEGHKGNPLSISADARCAVSANEGTLTVWDPLTGEVKRKLEGFPAKSLHLSTDGKILACALQDNTILILDPMDAKVHQRLHEHTHEVSRVVLSPDGQLVVSALSNDSICLWDAKLGVELRRFEAPTGTISFSPDSTLLEFDDGFRVEVKEARSGHWLCSLSGHLGLIEAAGFSHDGRVLASASTDGTIRLWDVTGGREIGKFQHHDGFVETIAFSLDDLLLVSASSQGTVRIWDLNSTREGKSEEPRHVGSVDFLSLSRDAKRVASAGIDDTTIGIWDLDTGQKTKSLVGHDDGLKGVFFAPDRDSVVISVSRKKNVLFHDSISGDEKLTLDCSPETYVNLRATSLSPNGTTLGLSYPAKIEIWDLFSGYRRHILERDATTPAFTTLAFSFSDKLLGSGTEGGEVILWDLETGNKKWKAHLDTEPWIMAMAFSHDDSTLVTAGQTGISLLDVNTGVCLATFETDAAFDDVVFDSSGHRLLTGKGDLTLPPHETLGKDYIELEDLPCDGYGLSDNDTWVTWKSRNLLWLPPGYRPASSLFRGLTAIIGTTAGRVLILKFAEVPPDFDED